MPIDAIDKIRYVKKLERLKLAILERDPMIPSEVDGCLSCFWCGVDQDALDLRARGDRLGEDHADDCAWKLAGGNTTARR